MAQVAIKKLFPNTVQTKYGEKTKYDIYVDGPNGEFKFQAWQGNWNKDWNQGVMIEVPENNDSRWKVQDYQGKQYHTLGAPPEAMQSFGGASTPQQAQTPQQAPGAPQQGLDPANAFGERMNKTEERLDAVEKDLSDFKFEKMEESIAKDKDDIPVVKSDEEISIDGVQF